MDLSGRIRTLREQAGLTKTALAQPRYTVSFVSQIEAGRRRPSPDALDFFATRLGVTPRYLSTGIPDGAEDQLRYELEEAWQLLRQSELPEAAKRVTELLGRASAFGLPRVRGEILVLQGEVLAAKGDLRDAIDSYEEALEESLPLRRAGLAVSGLARAYRSIGDLSYAVDVLERFLSSQEQPLDAGVSAELHAVLVSLYFERGDIERAQRASERALSAAEQGVSPEIRARTYWNASRVLAEARRWDDALHMATRGRLLMEEMEDRRSAARLLNVAAFICLEAEPARSKEAKEYLDRAEAILRDAGTPADLAYVLTERARLALIQKKPAQALTAVGKALESVGDDDLERARCLFLRGRALVMQKHWVEAAEALQEAIGLFHDRGARQQEAACWRQLGEIHEREGRPEEAMKALRAGLDALDPAHSRA